MRALALLALAALAASTGAQAQETPPTANGPFLYLQEQGRDVIMLASMAERRTTDVGARTTTVLFLLADDQLIRGETVTEADCARGLRRSGTIFLQYVPDADTRTATVATAPGIDWSPPEALDGPLMDYLCQDGRHDPAQVSPRASTFVTPWLNRR
ncbi:MAG: hypothetical protein K2X07_09330 [Caulobacteraceae bacterium]|nr:hypothetical protein [Caulobacteraceae bacterium]